MAKIVDIYSEARRLYGPVVDAGIAALIIGVIFVAWFVFNLQPR